VQVITAGSSSHLPSSLQVLCRCLAWLTGSMYQLTAACHQSCRKGPLLTTTTTHYKLCNVAAGRATEEDVAAAWTLLKGFSAAQFRGLSQQYVGTPAARTKLREALLVSSSGRHPTHRSHCSSLPGNPAGRNCWIILPAAAITLVTAIAGRHGQAFTCCPLPPVPLCAAAGVQQHICSRGLDPWAAA
jgi:hypothetical protein